MEKNNVDFSIVFPFAEPYENSVRNVKTRGGKVFQNEPFQCQLANINIINEILSKKYMMFFTFIIFNLNYNVEEQV